MRARRIGDTDVSEIGLGAMPMSLEGRPDEAQSIATIHAALDAGITLIDTADAYSVGGDDTGHNERLVAKAFRQRGARRDDVVVATKGGHYRPGDGSWRVDGRPEHVKAACEASLAALDVDQIALYQFHRPDPNVPFAESIGAFADLREAGKVRMVGLSNVTVEQINEARAIVPIASVQNQFSFSFTSSAGELVCCAEAGIAFLAWSPLGGIGRAGRRDRYPEPFLQLADDRGVSPQQVALAWVLAQSPVAIPIPGSSRPETIRDSAAAAELDLSADELASLTPR